MVFGRFSSFLAGLVVGGGSVGYFAWKKLQTDLKVVDQSSLSRELSNATKKLHTDQLSLSNEMKQQNKYIETRITAMESLIREHLAPVKDKD